MREKIFTSEQIEWLKQNYPKKSDHYCRMHLHIGYTRLWMMAEQYGLEKENPSDFEVNKKISVTATKKLLHADENANGYCLDCTHYRHGGLCEKSGRWVGALWKKKCFIGEV